MNFIKNIVDNIKYGDPAKDARQMLLCMLCTESLSEPIGYLSCHHMMHINCLWDYYNILKEKKTKGPWNKPEPIVGIQPVSVECPVCAKVTTVPQGNDIQYLERSPKDCIMDKVRTKLVLDFREEEIQQNGTSQLPFHEVEFPPDYDGPEYEGPNIFSSLTTDNNDYATGNDDTKRSGRTLENNLDDEDSIGHNIKSPQMNMFFGTETPYPGHIILSSEDNNGGLLLKSPTPKDSKRQDNSGGQNVCAKGTASKNTQKTTKICCREHKKLTCTQFCDNCEIPVCEKCSPHTHKGHLVSSLSDDLPILTKKLDGKKGDLHVIINRQYLLEGQLDYLMQQQEDSLENMKNKVNRYANVAKEAIEAQRVKVISELEKVFKVQKEVYDLGIKQVKYNIQCTRKLEDTVDEMLQTSQAKLLMNRQSIDKRIDTHIDNCKGDGHWVSWLKTKAVFKPAQVNLQLGKVDREVIELKDNLTNTIAKKKEEHLKHPLRGIQYKLPQVCWTNIERPNLGHIENSNPQGALFLEDNSLLVAYEGRQCISKYIGKDIDLSFNLQDKENHFMPRDMAQFDSETVVATDSRFMSLRLFHNDGTNLRYMKRELFKGERVGEQSDPFGVTVLPNRFLAVSDCSHKMIYIVDPERQTCINSIGPKANAKPLFNRPQFLSFDNQHNRIIVTDTKSHTVKLFDLNGSLVGKIGNPKEVKRAVQFQDGSYAEQYEGLQEPGATACDLNGNILVADGGHHQICQFDKTGQFVSVVKLYEKNRPVSLFWPQGLAIGPTGQVAVTEKTSGKVTVAQLYK